MNAIIAISVAIALALGGGYFTGHSYGFDEGKELVQREFDKYKKEQEVKYTQAIQKYRNIEQNMQENAAAAQEKHREQIRIIDKRLSAALVELRNRPERRTSSPDSSMPGATETCSGVSGAALARGDGEFLAGYAADAKKQREALKLCEKRYEEVRNAASVLH